MPSSLYVDDMGRTSSQGRRNGVRRARLAAELTQAELASGVGVTRQTVAAVEAGDYAPSVYLALAIARRLGSTVEDLFAEPTPETNPTVALVVAPNQASAATKGR